MGSHLGPVPPAFKEAGVLRMEKGLRCEEIWEAMRRKAGIHEGI
jgi:hypothetical protein